MDTIQKYILNGKTFYFMTAFHNKNPANEELTQQEMKLLEQVSRRLKKTAAVFYQEEPRCEAIMRAMRRLNPGMITWNGFLVTQDDDLLRHASPLWNISFESYKEVHQNVGVNANIYASKALAEIDMLLPHTEVKKPVDIYFVIVEHPMYVSALTLHLADKFDKRTWQNDVERHTHQDGAVIKLTKTDMLVISPPRVN